MRVTIPEHTGDITLGQFQRLEKLRVGKNTTPNDYEETLINILTGIPKDKIKHITTKDYDKIIAKLTTAINTKGEFKQVFTFEGVEYGMIPNLDEMSKNEFWHLSEYEKDVKDLHLLMAVLFRPITKKDKLGNYKIEPFTTAKERGEIFKRLPMSQVNGATGFFLTLSKQLKRAIQKSTAQALARVAKHKTTLLSGVGMLP